MMNISYAGVQHDIKRMGKGAGGLAYRTYLNYRLDACVRPTPAYFRLAEFAHDM
jgi:hypothetical protein